MDNKNRHGVSKNLEVHFLRYIALGYLNETLVADG